MRRAIQFRDLRALIRSLFAQGFKPTVRKALWALGTRGINLPFRHEMPSHQFDTNLPAWNAADLEQRARILRSEPPKSNFKTYAFYLPQFHSIPENDAWWGDGFTEWTNVKKAKKFFEYHYQPHVPLENNYYDLSNPETMREQARLAKLFGLDAFVMYYYWFDGAKLLETPLQNLMKDPTIEFPFVLCWANETWTRNWDGQPDQVLIEQKYTNDFAQKFISDIAKHFHDLRYQTFEGKPILLVYRPELIPNIIQTTEIWRNHVKAMGFSDLYLVSVNSFENNDPTGLGLDAATNFAPNNFGLTPKKDLDFEGKIYDYSELVKAVQRDSTRYPIYKCVTPSWDNTARRGSAGSVFINSNPNSFRNWLFHEASVTSHTYSKEQERIIFINAWNEWGEGCHLEPDQEHGYQWLHALADVKEELYWSQFKPLHRRHETEKVELRYFGGRRSKPRFTKDKVILVVHDLNPNGAQMNGLALLKEFRLKNVQVEVFSLESGKLRQEFNQETEDNIFIVSEKTEQELQDKLKELSEKGYRSAIFNSVASGRIAELLHFHKFKIVSLIHEFPETISQYALEKSAIDLARFSETIVFPSKKVLNEFKQTYEIKCDVVIQPQGLYNIATLRVHPEWENTQTHMSLGIPSSGRIVIGLGYGDYRKGFDIFCNVARESKDLWFIWVGDLDTNDSRIRDVIHNKPQNVRVIGFTEEVSHYLSVAQCLFLCSRRDPFPSVALEALGRGIPVVAIQGYTGMDDLFISLNLTTSKSENPKEILHLINSAIDTYSNEKKQNYKNYIKLNYNFRRYATKVLNWADIMPKTITVLIPSYNYAQYLINRLDQIESQTYSIDKLFFIDDFSSDKSFEIGSDFLELSRIPSCLIQNKENSGSPFSSWIKIAELAETDYFWIAESDDVASVYFAQELLSIFSGVEGLVYCNSAQISSNGELLAVDFAEYLNPLKFHNFERAYSVNGVDEITKCLAIQNSIVNISSVMFSLKVMKSISSQFEEHGQGLKTSADWLLYVLVLENSSIAYTPITLNAQRRHVSSVVGSSARDLLIKEIERIHVFIESRHTLTLDVIESRQKFLTRVKTEN